MMRRIQKWTLGLVSGVSETLGELENHEAVTAAALSDMRAGLARAQAHARSLRNHHQRILQEAENARADAERWRERARKETSESRALECLRRSRSRAEHASAQEARAREGSAQLQEVEAQVKRHEARYVELSGKQRLFRAKQAAAQAASTCHKSLGGVERVDEVFERWEMKITERQYFPEDSSDLHQTRDEFSEGYDSREEAQVLRAEWLALKEAGRESTTQPKSPSTEPGSDSRQSDGEEQS